MFRGLNSALYHWYRTEKDVNLKWFLANMFFWKIRPGYYQFITKITAYYPFSLIHQERWFHASNEKARKIRDRLEVLSSQVGIPIMIENGYRDRYFSNFEATFTKDPKNTVEAIRSLNQVFQDNYGNVYVKDKEGRLEIFVDSRLL